LLEYGLEFYLPSTSPNQFNPEAMFHSAARLENLNIDRVYFGHFGMSENPHAVFEQLKQWLPKFVEVGERMVNEQPNSSFEEKTNAVFNGLFAMVCAFLDEQRIPREADVYEIIRLDLNVCAMGIVDYLQKR
jgi:hypothetical protein